MSENERQTGPINETELGTPLRPAQAQKTAPVPLRRVLLLAGLLAAAALVLGLLALRDRIAPARRHGTFSYAAPEEENTFRFVEGKYNAYAALGVGHFFAGQNIVCSRISNGVRHKAKLLF